MTARPTDSPPRQNASSPLPPLKPLVLAILLAHSAPAVLAQQEQQWACRAEAGQWVCSEIAGGDGSQPGNQRGSRTADRASALGWRPLEELPPELKDQVPSQCCGAYVPPEAAAQSEAEAPLSPEEASSRLEYELLEGDLQTRYEVSGGVTITQGARRATAERAQVDEEADTATLTGGIRIHEPGLLMVGEEARVNRSNGAAQIEDGQFVLYESRTRGAASRIRRDENEVITLEGGMFTQCEPGAEHWAVRGSSITVDPARNLGIARHARVEVGGLPIFYWPYLPFPIGDERRSGFLFPTITTDDVAVPYYLNLAPNADMTLTPRYVAERGAMLEAEFRHLGPLFETVLGGAFMPNGKDDLSDNEEEAFEAGQITLEEATEFDQQDRWLGSVQQTGGRGRNWYSIIDYTRVSDYAYFSHLDTTNLDVNRATHLLQSGEVGYRLPNWLINTRLVEYQTIALDIDEPYQKLPEVNADGRYRWGDLSLALDNQFTRFDHDADFLDPDAPLPERRPITGSRARLDYELSWDKEWLWGFFRPAALLKSINYKLDEEALRPGAELEPSITVPQGAVDMGLFFERDGNWFGKGYLQTFEPRLFYFYSDFESHEDLLDITPDGRDLNFDTSELTFSYSQLFRSSRFAGGDRIEDANQLSVGLTSRFMSNKGVERLSLSLGQIYYQDDRDVVLNGGRSSTRGDQSPLAGQFSAQLTDSLRFDSDLLYDTDAEKMERGHANLRYLDDEQRIVNIGYRYDREPPRSVNGRLVDQTRSQGDLSFVWPLTDSWAMLGRQYYDFTNERELDSLAGLEYTSCCYRFRVVWRRWLDNDLINRVNDPTLALEYDQGVFFELQFRGLGGVGSSNIQDALSEGIYNFNRREEAILGRPVD